MIWKGGMVLFLRLVRYGRAGLGAIIIILLISSVEPGSELSKQGSYPRFKSSAIGLEAFSRTSSSCVQEITRPLVMTKPIIKSSVTSDLDIGIGFGFKSWTYFRAWIRHQPPKNWTQRPTSASIQGVQRHSVMTNWMKKILP